MKRKLLIICGPTSTGKTRLAVRLAKKFDGEIVSVDSRQVYKGIDIGTGKDLPVNSKFQTLNSKLGFYLIQSIKLWGYDLVDPKSDFSVAQYGRFARNIIDDVQRRGKLPILAGGTGLYIKGVVDGIATASIPQNKKLRKSLKNKSILGLFEILAQLDPVKAASMNSSDRKNPPRLIRAIEVAVSKTPAAKLQHTRYKIRDTLFIGLTAPKNALFNRIEKRTTERISRGIEGEIKGLLARGVRWEDQSMTSLGYHQWRGYFEGKKSQEEVVSDWIREEKQYAKRQITWFKADKRINWFDITKRDFQKKVEKMVEKWYPLGQR